MGVGIRIQITAQKTQWKISVLLSEPIIFAKNPQCIGRGNMKNYGSIKIVNITLENASAIEKMVNKVIGDFNREKT